MRALASLASLALAVLLAAAPPAAATVWHVYDDGSGDAPTIQTAIDLATDGDFVVPHAGTYTGYITMKDGVSLVGVDGPDVTVIQAPPNPQGTTPIIDVSNVGDTTWLIGLTIGGGGPGVGVGGTASSIQIKGNRIEDNMAYEGTYGAAIHLSGDGSPRVVENIFRNNHQATHHNYGVRGGTLYIATGGHATVARNEFYDNGDTDSGTDGGIAVEGDCTVEDNVLIRCHDQDAGIAVWNGQATIAGNIVAGSVGNAYYDEAPSTCGIYAALSSGVILNNTVYDNRAVYWFRPPPEYIERAGIRAGNAVGSTGALRIERNLVVRNGGAGISVWSPQTTVISCNLTWNNGGDDLSGIAPDPGHLDTNPYLCDPGADDFRLVTGSPALAGPCGPVGAVTETCETTSGSGPDRLALSLRAVPNPFNPSTTIHATVPVAGRVTIAVYDVAGRRVRTLFDRTVAAGEVTVAWDGTDARGRAGASGVYFARLTASGLLTTEKLVLLK